MNDIVQVDGFENRLPLLRFEQKGKGITNITGEKLYESQVTTAVQKTQGRLGLESGFFQARSSRNTASPFSPSTAEGPE